MTCMCQSLPHRPECPDSQPPLWHASFAFTIKPSPEHPGFFQAACDEPGVSALARTPSRALAFALDSLSQRLRGLT